MTSSPVLSTDAALRAAVSGDGTARVVVLPRDFQGLPGAAHGGTVLALFDAVAGAGGARSVHGVYRRRVPLGAPLALRVTRDDHDAATHVALHEGPTALVEGTVRASVPGSAPPVPAAPRTARPLPLSKTCFACGTDNALGLRARLTFDDTQVWGRWTPREALRAGDIVTPVAVTTLLDEAAFWLGAAASGEAGMTTDLRIALHTPVPFGRAVVVAGPRARVRPLADDPRYWQTHVAAWDEDGTLVATAAITFVAVRGTARKLVAGLLAINPPDVLRAIFPAHAG